jgi:TRAF3-interacting protein 1
MESQSKGGFANEDDMKGGFDSKRFPGDSAPSSERGKSRSGTRGGKPALMSDGSVGLTTAPSRPANLDGEVERCDGSIELTQELMGSLIQRPKMTEKLLAKPPFRFLHDIVTEVNRVTGFATGLYTPEEMDSANVTEKEKKIEYLQRIIDLVGMHLSTLVEAKPSKIVMGVEAQDTNRFLQLLAVAAKNMPDSRASVAAVLDRNGLAPASATRPAPAPQAAPQVAPADDIRADEKPRPVKVSACSDKFYSQSLIYKSV